LPISIQIHGLISLSFRSKCINISKRYVRNYHSFQVLNLKTYNWMKKVGSISLNHNDQLISHAPSPNFWLGHYELRITNSIVASAEDLGYNILSYGYYKEEMHEIISVHATFQLSTKNWPLLTMEMMQEETYVERWSLQKCG